MRRSQVSPRCTPQPRRPRPGRQTRSQPNLIPTENRDGVPLRDAVPFLKDKLERSDIMKTANLIRWGALAAFASGVLWIAGGILHLAYPQDPPGALGYYLNYLGTAIFSAAYLGMLGGLVGLHVRQMDGYGTLGRAGFLVAFAGAALVFVGQVTSGVFPHNEALGWLFGDPGFG